MAIHIVSEREKPSEGWMIDDKEIQSKFKAQANISSLPDDEQEGSWLKESARINTFRNQVATVPDSVLFVSYP